VICSKSVKSITSFPKFNLLPLPIDRIDRSSDPVKIRGDKDLEFSWAVHLNDREGGLITFRSTGYRLEQIGEPAEFVEQTIPKNRRI